MACVAILDVGKTNVKLSAATREGHILTTVSTPNPTLPGPPYRHPDLAGIEDWFFGELRALARRHPIDAIVACGHGSAGVLVDDDGPVVPMMDYEEEMPGAVDDAYRKAVGSAELGGTQTPRGVVNLARQLFWIETNWPEAVTRARWFLGGPQYWGWRLSGVPAAELTYLGAESQLWDIRRGRFAPIVPERGWRRLIPDIRPAWQSLGPLEPELAHRLDLPEGVQVLCGIHDSTANFYRCQQAGLNRLAVISTGTWIVGLSDYFDPQAASGAGGAALNADVHGRPLTGILAMGGREFAAIAGEGAAGPIDPSLLGDLARRGTMALPSFANDDGPYPDSAGRGRIAGPRPTVPDERKALALLYVALMTDACLDAIGGEGTAVLDGSFVRDPLYPALVARLRAGRPTLYSADAYGTAAGAALLADHGRRGGSARVVFEEPRPLELPWLDDYRNRWRRLARDGAGVSTSEGLT